MIIIIFYYQVSIDLMITITQLKKSIFPKKKKQFMDKILKIPMKII